ncbi:cytochrome b [Andreprevotia chitinilytica]|uniref:cytochrome b n=1 Tax=Andreprevotia chitinilytica TaxID=396808 RepID=UPI0005516385|nr:cytochrome b/b6 domain-containing protein [Andreprevotia chitinilytica]
MTRHAPFIPQEAPQRYDLLTRIMHWVFAVAIIYATCAGFALHVITNPTAWRIISVLNMSLATCLIVMFPIRYLWKFFRKEPAEIDSIPAVQISAAHLVHSLIYVLTAVVLTSGFLMVPDGYSFFGFLHIPTLFQAGPVTSHWNAIHRFGCMTLAAIVVLHVAAVLKHRFILKNNVLQRML